MKILVFSDLHGSTSAVDFIADKTAELHPDKVVVCGDVMNGRRSDNEHIERTLKSLDTVLYVVQGNCDYPPCMQLDFERYAVMYHFGKTLFFTHGNEYNCYRLPPVIGKGDVLVYGHTHTGRIFDVDGVTVANVGSLACPRGGADKNFLVLDDDGIALVGVDGKIISKRLWNNAN